MPLNFGGRRFRTCCRVICLALCLAHPAAAQSSDETRSRPFSSWEQIQVDAELSGLAAREVEAQQLPGLVCGYFEISKPGRIGAAGLRQVGIDEALQASDLVHIGSCTKALTALLAATAVDEGRLTWQSTIGDVLPEIADQIDPSYRPVSLQMLLNHRGNIPPNGVYPRIEPDVDPRPARRQAIVAALKRPPRQKSEAKFEYSNLGYVVAGHMLETVYNDSWENLLRARVFGPLGISQQEVGFGPPRSKLRSDQPSGHRRTPEGAALAMNIDNALSMGPAGTVHCSLPAWARCCAAHFLPHTEGGLLKEETLAALHSDDAGQHYAGGWILADRPELGGPFWTHTGSNTVWTATAIVSPAHQCIYLAATNISDKDTAKLTIGVLKEVVQLHQSRK